MFWSFVIASVLIELTPGPNMTWFAVLGASRGRVVALAAVTGRYLGLAIAGIVAGIAIFSGSLEAFLKTLPKAITICKILAILIAPAAAWFFYSMKVTQ